VLRVGKKHYRYAARNSAVRAEITVVLYPKASEIKSEGNITHKINKDLLAM
jgi:hypothetical protein